MQTQSIRATHGSHQHFLACEVAGRAVALRAGDVVEVLPMAALFDEPGDSTILAGFLNLGGDAVAVLHLSRLLDASAEPGVGDTHGAIVLVRHGTGREGLLVTRATQVVTAPATDVVDLPGMAMTKQAVRHGGAMLPVVCVSELVMERERRWIERRRAYHQRRLRDLPTEPAA